jgi:hypothetical protein
LRDRAANSVPSMEAAMEAADGITVKWGRPPAAARIPSRTKEARSPKP